MAQETNILIQVSDDGITGWADLATLAANSITYTHIDLAIPSTKYYRTIAKGDGVSTLDSDPSAVINISNGFVPEYQAVLDQMTADVVTHPSLSQNIKNDLIVRKLIAEGKWIEADVFWYFEQEVGTPYEALTYNWIDPSKHRLTNIGTNNVAFEGGKGFSVTGGNSQVFNTNFNPSIDAVKCVVASNSMIFKLFNVPATYTAPCRILAGDGKVNVLLNANKSILPRFYEVGSASKTLAENSMFNAQIHITEIAGVEKFFLNGNEYSPTEQTAATALDAASLHMFGANQSSGFPSEGGFGIAYMMLASGNFDTAYKYNEILNSVQNPLVQDGVLKFTTSGVSIPSFLFTEVIEASKFPMSTASGKPFIVLLGTDHANPVSEGACIWGEADSPDLTGFIERGTIVSGFQSETPHLQYVPDDPDGDVIHFYYHPDVSHPDSGGYQQTRLLTRSDLNLHDAAGWTDRGKVLGIIDAPNTENHTGYLQTYSQGDGSFVGTHNTKGVTGTTVSGIPRMGISTAPSTGRVWTRVTSYLDNTSFMPGTDRQFHMSPSLYFTRNGIQYCVARNAKFDFNNTTSDICIAQCDGNYVPTSFIRNITSPQGGYGNTAASYYINPLDLDTLHIYYVKNQTNMYHTTWNLKNLD